MLACDPGLVVFLSFATTHPGILQRRHLGACGPCTLSHGQPSADLDVDQRSGTETWVKQDAAVLGEKTILEPMEIETCIMFIFVYTRDSKCTKISATSAKAPLPVICPEKVHLA